MNAKHAWAAIGIGVLAYNATAKDGELLSEQCDRWLVVHPVATRVIVTMVALHLINAVPSKYDAIHAGFTGIRKARDGRHLHFRLVP